MRRVLIDECNRGFEFEEHYRRDNNLMQSWERTRPYPRPDF
jgi:hypothetical protein